MENYFLRKKLKIHVLIPFVCCLLFSCSDSIGNSHTAQSSVGHSTNEINLSQDSRSTELGDIDNYDTTELTSTTDPPKNTNPSDLGYVYTHQTGTDGMDEITIHIPHINISPEIDTVVNAYIDSRFTENIDEYRRIEYSYTINGSLMSMLIRAHWGTDYGGCTSMYTVTVDMDTGTIITLPEILDRYGYDYIETTRKYNRTTSYPEEAQQLVGSAKADFAIFDFHAEQFYITSENHICLVGSLYRGRIIDPDIYVNSVDPLYSFCVIWDIAADEIIEIY